MKVLLKKLLPNRVLLEVRRWREQQRQLRFENAAPRKRENYLTSCVTPMLVLGCGPYGLDGWLNTDIVEHNGKVVYLDCTQRFPVPHSTFRYVFSEHLIEHLDYEEGQISLSESFRVLQPGGKVRIATPDLRFLVALYQSPKTDVQKRYIAWSKERWPDVATAKDVFVINHFFRAWGHRFIYDPKTLEEAMKQAGFSAIRSWSPGESEGDALRGIEQHGKAISDEFNNLETFVLEGQKPS